MSTHWNPPSAGEPSSRAQSSLQSTRPRTFHRRSGVLKTTSEQAAIARQRSKALYDAVSDGDICLDDILAIPIDWQGMASELQWRKERDLQGDEDIPTLNPLATKSRSRPRLGEEREQQEQPRQPQALALGLNLCTPSVSVEDAQSDDCPSPPGLSSSSSSSSSSSCDSMSVASPPSTPTLQHLDKKTDVCFDLQSYCTAFSDADRKQTNRSASPFLVHA